MNQKLIVLEHKVFHGWRRTTCGTHVDAGRFPSAQIGDTAQSFEGIVP